jgi:hypothetical protein
VLGPNPEQHVDVGLLAGDVERDLDVARDRVQLVSGPLELGGRLTR